MAEENLGLNNDFNFGYGCGYGCGYGYGDGFGFGHGYNYSDGNGYIRGNGFGYGAGYIYGDGSGYGIQKELLSKFKNAIKPELILKETNAEYRMQLIELVGVVRLIKKLGAKVIEKGVDHCGQKCELLNFDIIDGTFRPYLKLINPSTKTCHIEGVHPSCDTIEKALRWRNKNKEKPNIIT